MKRFLRPFIAVVFVVGVICVLGSALKVGTGDDFYIGTTNVVGALAGKQNALAPVYAGNGTGQFTLGSVADTDAATITTDAATGNYFRVTLAGNRTLGNPSNALDGQRIIWELIQDGTGTRILAYDTKFAFGTDITGAVLTTTASKRDFLTVLYNSTADKFYVVAFVKGY